MNFKFIHLDIPDIILVHSETFSDKRGFFSETYKEVDFAPYGIGPFIQENYSSSIRSVVRGLHYQASPMQVGKLVSCPHGEIYDVVVDIRKDSPTFKMWTGAILTNGDMLWVPPGFAHGFCVLSERASVVYRQTQYYNKEYDRCIRWNDPSINIRWPISDPIISVKDFTAPLLRDVSIDDLL